MKTITTFVIALAAISLTGCGTTSPSKFYSLNSTAQGNGADTACHVIVGPVFIPADVDRPQFALTTGPNQVAIDEFNRWDSPLADGIARAVSGDLRQLLGASASVTAAPLPGFGPAYQVVLRVEQFETVAGAKKRNGEASVVLVWSLSAPSGDKVSSGTVTAEEPAAGGDSAALAAAHSRALAKVSENIASAIRAAAAAK
jgi:uncharacterized lipoprotein YmbA